MAAALAADWSVDQVVILDLALAVPELATKLGPTGPRLLAVGGPGHAGLALAANLVDFIAEAPTDAELAAALDDARSQPSLAGVGDLSDRAVARLGALGSEATRVAAALARLEAATMQQPVPPVDPVRLRGMIDDRRARDRFFPREIFGEPAWDMLLDLMLAAEEGREVAVSSLCIAAVVPTTTALRCIRNLIDLRLFERHNDPRDARRAFIRLSDPAQAAMARYLAQRR